MFFALLLLILFSTTSPHPLLPGALPHKYVPFREMSRHRIVGGTHASKGEFPWQAAIYVSAPFGITFFCSGSLISPTWILTAAQCLEGAVSITVYLGIVSLNDNSRIAASVFRAITHPSYSPETLANDVALLQLRTSVAISANIRPIRLSDDYLGSGATVTASGWGITHDEATSLSQNLNYARLVTITNNRCQQFYADIISSGHVCARGDFRESICPGDSGGALITGFNDSALHVGIASFTSSAGCESGDPSGFIRTATYRSWIKSIAGV